MTDETGNAQMRGVSDIRKGRMPCCAGSRCDGAASREALPTRLDHSMNKINEGLWYLDDVSKITFAAILEKPICELS